MLVFLHLPQVLHVLARTRLDLGVGVADVEHRLAVLAEVLVEALVVLGPPEPHGRLVEERE